MEGLVMWTHSKKAQVSFEFIMIFTLVILALTGFIYIINIRLTEIRIEQETLVMKNLARNIENEIILASSVNNFYVRRFDIPTNILGNEYDMEIQENVLVINLLQDNLSQKEYFTPLPLDVKGTFVRNINENTTDHCITKNDLDGIRISRNQASLDTNVTSVGIDDEFDVFISLNCVQNAKSIQVTVKYDPATLELLEDEVEPVVLSNINLKNYNPLFSGYHKILDYSKAAGKYIHDGRYTYGYLGKGCASGSGNIAKLRFKVLDTAPRGVTKIEFDEVFETQFDEENIRILDCSTNKFTVEGLPDTKNDAVIMIE
jgi:uncharacterized protein (UPF0333 family)